jgi:hypothetical protein
MSDFWQDQINSELRTLRHEEARERRSIEDQLLHTGHVVEDAGSKAPLTEWKARFLRHTIRFPRTAVRRLRLVLWGQSF